MPSRCPCPPSTSSCTYQHRQAVRRQAGIYLFWCSLPLGSLLERGVYWSALAMGAHFITFKPACQSSIRPDSCSVSMVSPSVNTPYDTVLRLVIQLACMKFVHKLNTLRADSTMQCLVLSPIQTCQLHWFCLVGVHVISSFPRAAAQLHVFYGLAL